MEDKDQSFTVSVVIPAYNIGKLVGRAIDSVLAQTYQPDEIIVVDDGSTDSTADVIKSYGSKVRYVYQDNLGLAGARNTGIRAATCEWIAFLDGDDEWLSEKLQLQMDILQRNEGLVWCTGNFLDCLCSEQRRGPSFQPERACRLLGGKDYFDDFLDAYMSDAAGNSNTMTVKRSVLEEAGFFREGMPCAEDIDMWFRIAMRRPKIGCVTRPVAVYHLHRPGSLIHDLTSAERHEVICDMFERSIKLATQYDRMDKFKPCMAFCLHRRIRRSLFEYKMAPMVTDMMERFDPFLSDGYKTLIRFLLLFPKVTATILHMVSTVVRLFGLRRKILRRPRK